MALPAVKILVKDHLDVDRPILFINVDLELFHPVAESPGDLKLGAAPSFEDQCP